MKNLSKETILMFLASLFVEDFTIYESVHHSELRQIVNDGIC